MNVTAKISCYFERSTTTTTTTTTARSLTCHMSATSDESQARRSVVTLKLRKEYLNIVTYNTSVLLGIKC